MKQVVQNYKSGELAVVDVPEPTCKRGGILVRKAVEDEKARRDRPALPVDRIEVPRAGQTVRAFHDSSLRGRVSTPRASSGPCRGAA